MESRKRLRRRRTIGRKRSNGGQINKRGRDGAGKAEMGSARWERSLNRDLLLDIFSRLKPLFVLTTVSWVCRSWGRVCFDHFFGKEGENTLNFTPLKSDFCRKLFLFEDTPFKKLVLMKLLRGVMGAYAIDDEDEDGGDGYSYDKDIRVTSITKMVFPSGLLQLTDHHLVYLAEWSPKLRELSLPCGRYIRHKGFSRAICYWNGIEEMSIGPFVFNYDVYRIIEAIGINCKKLEILRLFGFFLNQQLSPEIAQSLKGLKLLRLQNVHIAKVGLKNLLSKCKKLQKVEIWHCLTLEGKKSDFLASCEIKKTEMDGVIKWSLSRDAELYDMNNLLNLLWQ